MDHLPTGIFTLSVTLERDKHATFWYLFPIMLWRVKDILPVIAEHWRGSGAVHCGPTDTELYRAYNRINENLMNRRDWPGTEAHVLLPVYTATFTLPDRFESIKALRVADGGLPILPLGFQFLPGQLDALDPLNQVQGLQHLGSHFATHRDPPRPMTIFAVSDRMEEQNATLTIHGQSAGRHVREVIPIAQASPEASPIHSHTAWQRIDAIAKPPTSGHIEICGWDDDTGESVWLSTIEPDETSPALTRYKLPIAEGQACHIQALVSLAYRELWRPDDVSLVQHREAYRLMAQALIGFDSQQPGLGAEFQNRAIRLLKDRCAKLASGQRAALPFEPPRQFKRPYSIRGY